MTGNSGQECLQRTFLTPFWENPMYFGMLAVGLIGIWIVVMLWLVLCELKLILKKCLLSDRRIAVCRKCLDLC